MMLLLTRVKGGKPAWISFRGFYTKYLLASRLHDDLVLRTLLR